MFLPGPGGAERLVERPAGLPTQLGVRKRGVGPDGDDVARTPRSDLVGNLHAVDLLEFVHQLQYRNAVAGADVEDLTALVG